MSAEPARAYFGIGEVIAQLRSEFPDISVSKIRFLESEGLIQPARSPSGYRKFAPADVDRLRYILTAQRDRYLPLRSGRLYPPQALEAIRAVAALGQYGVQARNLRVLRASADRETALIEQIVAPILRQRSPGARDRASLAAQDIASLVLTVHAAVVEMTLADAGFAAPAPGGPGG
jgi:hypothetical protein